MGEVTQEKHPVDGHMMELRKDVRKPERMAEYGTFEATETRARAGDLLRARRT